MEQVEALTVLDSEIYVGNFSENLNHDFVVQSDSIMQGGVSLGILHMETQANTGYQPQKLQGNPRELLKVLTSSEGLTQHRTALPPHKHTLKMGWAQVTIIASLKNLKNLIAGNRSVATTHRNSRSAFPGSLNPAENADVMKKGQTQTWNFRVLKSSNISHAF